ncbi:MAG TPA: sulfatase-like hydrolase/transferase, partial [Thermoanaerobaculia bacterium]|nr:sulfatase-like hydrolase/transferase [Thermoanaerobaculia bacterium]
MIPAILLVALLTAISAALLSGCRRLGGSGEASSGPIVLITLEGLRADAVGGLGGESGLTPHLDALIRNAGRTDWAGRGVAPSSATIPSLASLWTGLRPWQHQALDARRAALPTGRLTLPEALRAAGYHTESFTSGPWLKPRFGYARGFDDCRELGKAWAAT